MFGGIELLKSNMKWLFIGKAGSTKWATCWLFNATLSDPAGRWFGYHHGKGVFELETQAHRLSW